MYSDNRAIDVTNQVKKTNFTMYSDNRAIDVTNLVKKN